MSSAKNSSKSLPASEFQLYLNGSGEDSGIDSDTSPVSSTRLTTSAEEIEDEMTINPNTFILGKSAPDNERLDGITKALSWIRGELTKMKETDKELTRTFITVRSKIAEQRCILDDEDYQQGYFDTDSIPKDEKKNKSDNWNVIAKDGAFPTNGLNFENNKRATWVI